MVGKSSGIWLYCNSRDYSGAGRARHVAMRRCRGRDVAMAKREWLSLAARSVLGLSRGK